MHEDEPIPMPEEPAEIVDETAEEDGTELVTQELNDLRDQLLRTMADFQNFRRRAQQEKIDLHKRAAEDLVRDLLPVLDNFERTLAAAEQGATAEALVDGVKLVHRQFLTALERRHVKRIATVGQPFDAEFHEAIGTDPAEESEQGTITAEIEAGFVMGERVIRPARVKVAQ